MEKTVVAICYDFDKTLATSDMQSFTFIPTLGFKEDEFWKLSDGFGKKVGCDSTLSYLRTMIDECDKRGIKLTRDFLKSMGKGIKYFDGVTNWFKRINEYASERNIQIEHYIISSGNKEILEGCSIYNEFKEAYGCEYLYNEDGVAYWPKTIVNYTLKTQYIFRICKGTTDLTDEEKINERVDKKHVEFRNIIYIGDGLTDVPAMTLVKEKGGTAISVFTLNKKEKAKKLYEEGRVNYACKGDYSLGSSLDKYIKMKLDSISLTEQLLYKETSIQDKLN